MTVLCLIDYVSLGVVLVPVVVKVGVILLRSAMNSKDPRRCQEVRGADGTMIPNKWL